MYWFLDNASLWYVLFGIVGLGFGAAWWVHRRPKLLIGVAAAVGLIALVWLLTHQVVTDKRQIDSIVHEMANAAVEGKSDIFLSHLAKDFDYEGKKGPIVAEKIAKAAKYFKVFDIVITGLDIEEQQQDSAKVYFLCTVKSRLDDRPQLIECRAVFLREGNRWKAKSTRFNFPLSNQPVILPID